MKKNSTADFTTYLELERLFLREVKPSDFSHLLDLDSDPEVVKYLSDGKASTPDQIKSSLERIQSLYEKFDHKLGFWIATEKQTDNFLGWFLLRPAKSDPAKVMDLVLGYRLKKDFWGKGYASEMSKCLLQKAFTELGARSVFATTMTENKASQKVMKEIGMKFHSDYLETQFPGKNKNAVKFELVLADWKALRINRMES